MKLIETINPEGATEDEANKYPVREASRAVVVDSEGKIALLHVSKGRYYKLPGGGIEQSEDKVAALQRECLEEIGCNIEVIDEIGAIIEYRKFCHLKQISYCFFATPKGEKGEPNFMADEAEEGFEVAWVTYTEAVALLLKNEAVELEGRSYIVPRDASFLKIAGAFIKGSGNLS